ncbi:hypothetical protein BS333_19060 [Vibrio azureus]|uniref:Uncharacterized protein n=1 Tax=Vibrio azureus NBRC 104587 TaxID=1219077 RepID=U3C7X8_9VIBR|nr:hypothetical protein [Vibrio azureus]AUI88428.1 hypothetical protein BS333_19060 [Vibrio azureus]GAD77489.1 hypothetical protein VAZ01S_077_00260 [Vibrio azureus NBRC 104587]
MNTPKKYLSAFLFTVIIAGLLFYYASLGKSTPISAFVINNTLTQSLDGQRRYLTVHFESIGQRRVLVPVTANCPESFLVTFSQVRRPFIEPSFTFLHCKPPIPSAN